MASVVIAFSTQTGDLDHRAIGQHHRPGAVLDAGGEVLELLRHVNRSLFVGIGIGAEIDIGRWLIEQHRAHRAAHQHDLAIMPEEGITQVMECWCDHVVIALMN